MDTVNDIYAFFVALVNGPREIVALVAGTLISWGLTQRLKFFVPFDWSYHAREVATQAISFALGMLATVLLWPELGAAALVGGIVVGLWSPALWSVLMLAVGWWKPGLKEALSQDVREGVRGSSP